MSTRPSRPLGQPWGLAEAAAGFLVGIVVSIVCTGLAEDLGAPAPRGGATVSLGVLAADLVGLWIGLVGAAVLASRRHGTGHLAADFGLRARPWDLLVGAGIGVAFQYLVIPALYWPFEQLDPSLRRQVGRAAGHLVGSATSAPDIALRMVLLALAAPVVEELFFRGLLLRALLARMPAPAAVVLSGIVFGLAHFEPVDLAGLAVFGAALALLAWRTGRLGPGIAAHAAFNAAAVVSVARLH